MTQFPEEEDVGLPTSEDFKLGRSWPQYTHKIVEETLSKVYPHSQTETDIGPPSHKVTAKIMDHLMIPVTDNLRKSLWWELRKAKRRTMEQQGGDQKRLRKR